MAHAGYAIKCAAVLGVLVAAGGTVGYVQSGSAKSLVAGLLSGAMLGLAAALNSLELAAAVSSLLTVVFAMRLRKTGKFIPSGLLLIVCGLGLLLFVFELANKHKTPQRKAS